MDSTDQKRAFLAVILSGIVLFAWQAYFAPKVAPPEGGGEISSAIVSKSLGTSQEEKIQLEKDVESRELSKSKRDLFQKSSQTQTTKLILENNGHTALIGSDLLIRGMSNPNQANVFDQITGKDPLKIQIMRDGRGVDLAFKIESSTDKKSFRGTHSKLGIQLKGRLDEEGRLQLSLVSSRPYLYRLLYMSKADDLGNNRIRQYIVHTKEVDRFDVGSEETSDGLVNFVGIDHHYHLFALALREQSIARYKAFSNGQMWIDFTEPTKNFEGFLVYTKKNYDHLATLGKKLELSVDFGFFAILAIPILRGLQFFYEYFPNYGIAIIFLTLVIRLITFPLQFKSFKSMKKMQVIQPELQKLKEKYSDDPQRMQKETMELFRKAGANPLGGCFPMLLQMPIFFAFYQVLYNAVELVGAPFYFWITDLSEKDPYYVLPILMGAAMFGQTKLNPSTTTDPTQQKVMLFMPLIFTFIMKDFPAGLNLYIFVSTLFGIAQQLIVYKTID